MRTWKCPACGHTTEISYDWLAANGAPICVRCDNDVDMELLPLASSVQPPAETQTQPESHNNRDNSVLIAKVEQLGLDGSDLDDVVHGVADSLAADVNNDGLEAQLGYLVQHLGIQGAIKDIERAAEDKDQG